jgi:hypothetical protein
MGNRLVLSVCFLFSCYFGMTQNEWKLKSEKDGMKIFSRDATDSKIKAVKINADFDAGLSTIAAVLMDVKNYDAWVFNSKSTRLLKQVSQEELYYYAISVFPWPTQNRDFVSHMHISQDPETKTVTVLANNVPGWVPKSDKLVRIEKSSGKWVLTKLSDQKTAVEYSLEADPAGSLPAWIINTFSSKGLIETFKNLRKQLGSPEIKNSSAAFIGE